MTHHDEQPRPDTVTPTPATAIVQCCPFCGEAVGSFFGDHGVDDSHWCESCGLDFIVRVVEPAAD